MSIAVLILAAGEGTRMKSQTPKVLHLALGRPLLGHVLQAAAGVGASTTAVVTGAGREQVELWLGNAHSDVLAVEQSERRGTGHATRIALEYLAGRGGLAEQVMVLSGDTPLLTAETLQQLVAHHQAQSAAATVLTAVLEDAAGYGRIVRNAAGDVESIVEHRDATAEQLQIREINSGIYMFATAPLREALTRINAQNSQGEEYLTDVLGLLRADGLKISALQAADSLDVLGVNDRVQLAAAAGQLRNRINEAWMRAGVTIVDPTSTWIEADVVIEPDAVIEPNCFLRGKTAVAAGAHIGPDTTLEDCVVQAGAEVLRSHALGASIGPRAKVGPFTFLRPGAELHEKAKAGAYVEIKNAVVGRGSKVPHLSYVGDAVIGTDSNIGAASVFVNYDGVAKHRTLVGDGVRIGSDTMLVAPVTVGDGAYTGAGSVITEDVPAGALALGRARQVNLLGWVLKRRAGSVSAEAANKAELNPSKETE